MYGSVMVRKLGGKSRHHFGKPCPQRIGRFLEPCLLLLLYRSEVHGYELQTELLQFGFDKNPVDLSTVYRMLRTLEARGLVSSRWDTETSGPPRRLYRSTQAGQSMLETWIADLRATDRILHHFLRRYDSMYTQVEKDNSGSN